MTPIPIFAQEIQSNEISEIKIELENLNKSFVESSILANKSFWLGISVSIVFAGIAIGATIWYSKHTRRQVDLLENDIKSRIRPILGRKFLERKKLTHKVDDVGRITNEVVRVNGGTSSFNRKKIMIHLENTGTLPALTPIKKYFVEIREERENHDNESMPPKLNHLNQEKSIPISSMGPNEMYSTDIPWPDDGKDYFSLARNTAHIYFGFIIWYYDEQKREFFYHMEGHYDHDAMMLDYVNMGTIDK